MHHHEYTPHPSQKAQAEHSAHPEANPLQDRLLALADRLYNKSVENGTATVFDTIKHLSTSGSADELNAYIEEVAFEGVTSDEEFSSNINVLKSARERGDTKAEESIRDRQNEILNTYKQAVMSLSGLEDGAGRDELALARDKTGAIIAEHLESGESQDELLQKLGILEVNEQGKEIFMYPEELFPEKTNEKWAVYLQKVKDHLKAERGAMSGTMSSHELGDADKIRRLAHNAVTRDVHTILGFDKLPESEWDFAKTRNLLAKMRDHKFPTVDTAEKERTTTEVMRAARILGVLGTRISEIER